MKAHATSLRLVSQLVGSVLLTCLLLLLAVAALA
jgi:hypothetical protein